jgi:uncharacterized protein
MSKQASKNRQQEHRSTIQASRLEVRESGGVKKLSGYAVVFNSPADIGGQFTEKVAPGAFTRTLNEDDQVILRDHQSEILLGRRSAGTLKLTQDDIGLAFSVTLPATANGDDAYENVRLGNLKGCSFGFIVRDDVWSQDSQGALTRVINDVQLFEITLTAFPAYEATSVAISRSARAKLNLRDDSGDCEDGQDLNDSGDCVDNDDDETSDSNDLWGDESEDYRCSYRCLACRSAAHAHLSNLAEDDPSARSKKITRAKSNLSEDALIQEQQRCAYRCAACRSLLGGHFPAPNAVNEDDQSARAAHLHLLGMRLR